MKLLFAIFSLLTIQVVAQDNLSYYFNDGNNEQDRNVFKFDLAHLVVNEANFYYERFFGNKFSVELGAGKLFGNFEKEKYEFSFASNLDSISFAEGNTFYSVETRFYPSPDGVIWDRFWVGFGVSQRNYTAGTNSLTHRDYNISSGCHYYLGNWGLAEIGQSIGLRYRSTDSYTGILYGFSWQFFIKLGFTI